MPDVANALRQRRLAQVREAGVLLYRAGARRVWLFGSLARGEPSDRCTDIDFAVEGLGEHKRRSLALRLRALLRCKVDIVGIEDAGPALRRTVAELRLLLPQTCGPAAASSSQVVDGSTSRSGSPRPVGLHQQRLQAVLDVLKDSGLDSVIDFGCGAGLLLERLAADPGCRQILGVDTSCDALAAARRRLGLGRDRDAAPKRIRLVRALATNPDPRFLGYEAAVAVEFIEHLDPARLSAFERVIFSFVRPRLFVVTTPNSEYNVFLGNGDSAGHRVSDHRFEWTRAQFRAWITRAAGRAGYACSARGIGAAHAHAGPPTQMAVCSRL